MENCNKERDDDNNASNFLKILFLIIFIASISKIKNKEIKMQNINEEISEKKIKNDMINERKAKEINDYEKFKTLKEKPKNMNDPLIKEEKNSILKKYSDNIGTVLNNGLSIYLDMKFNFGNQLLVLNKLIFYCEIIGCKKIIIQKNNNIYIKNTIYDKKYNITIELSERDNDFYLDNLDDNAFDEGKIKVDKEYYNDYQCLTFLDPYFYYNTYTFRIENKFYIFKKEILRNLPKIKTNKNDLYIHIRGSDIFQNKNPHYAPDYAQPPLCFYQKILNNYKYRKIFIISADKENPVIDALLKAYKNIIYKSNSSLEKDIASLAYAYNIVGSISSFLISTIKLNDNLKYFWEYDRYPTSLGNQHLHHSLYDFERSYTILKMLPSKIYNKEMIIWEGSDEQLRIMMNDTCTHNFIIVKPNKYFI